MNIGLEVTGCLTETQTGIANYIINLYKGLEKAGPENEIEAYIWLSNFKHRERLFKYFTPNKVSWHYKNYNLHRFTNRLDIAHSTDAKFLNLPGTKLVATVHDLAIFRKETLEIPDYTTPKFKDKVRRNLQVIAERSDQVITASQQTKVDFLEMFPQFDPERIEPIHLAGSLKEDYQIGDEPAVLEKFGVEEKAYFVFVGAVSVRKNLVNMIEAFKESGLHHETKLLLIGFRSMGIERILGAIEKHGLKDRVILTDYIDSKYIPTLYRHSLGLAFATFYEGFGIPIIEAMRNRTPVMFGNIGSAPEIGGEYGVCVNPFSITEIAEGFRELTDFKAEKLEAAREYAGQFSWEKTAEKTLAVYRKLL